MKRTRELNVALVGAGYVARFHAEVLAKVPGVRLRAVCDPDRRRAERLARAVGADVFASVDELQHGFDVAHVLTPPGTHVAVTQRLIAGGIGVFIEKPMALSVADAEAIAMEAARRGVPVGVNHNNVFHPAFERLSTVVRSGTIGRLEHVRSFFHVPVAQLQSGHLSHWMFRSPANILFEQAVHPFSQLAALVGSLQQLHATVLGSRRLANGVEFHDRWSISAVGAHATAELHLAFGGTFARNTLEVIGSDGSVEADLLNDVVTTEQKTYWLDFWNTYLASARRGAAYRRDAWRGVRDYVAYTAGIGPRRDAYFVGMQRCIADFYDALRQGTAPRVGALEGVEALRWCEASARAAAPPPVRRRRTSAAGTARPGEIVVLGGTGLIGSRVVSKLAALGKAITVVVRQPDAVDPDQFGAGGLPVRVVRGSLGDEAALAEAVTGARTVIHLATGNGETWEEVLEAMVDGTTSLARLALGAGVQRFIYVSSIAALYLGDAGAEIDDSRTVDPKAEERDIYSRGKAETERRLFKMYDEFGLPLIVVRPGVVLGPESPIQHSGLGWWPRDNHCLGWGAGTSHLPLVTADDVAEAIVLAACADADTLHGRALNLCARVPLSARDLVEAYAAASGRPIQFHAQPLWWTYSTDIFKWGVKSAAARRRLPFPSYRDLKSRALRVTFTAGNAREALGWKPIDDRDEFLAYLRTAGVGTPKVTT